MKFKNAVFVNEKFMEILSRCNTFEDWAPKDAYWFNRFVKKIRSAQEDYEDVRIKLIKKYGKKDDEGNMKVDKERIPEFSIDLGELMDEEFEIEGIKKIKFPDGIKLSPIEIGLVEEVFDMSVFEEDED